MRTGDFDISIHDSERHVRVEHYVRTSRDTAGSATLARQVLDHAVAVCPACRRQWEALGDGGQERVRGEISATFASSSPAAEPATTVADRATADADALREMLHRLRYRRRRAQKQLSELRQLSPAERRRRVADARTRFRSRMLAEMLIEESRQRVRNEPAEAESLAALVPLVLERQPGDDEREADPGHPAALLARAAAWRANALRVLGDLPAADRAFTRVRYELAQHRVRDPTVLAETASLEASLRIGQRRFPEAEELLDRAVLFHTVAGDALGCCRALIQQGTLLQTVGRPADAFARLEKAAAQLSEDDPPYLHVCTVTGRVNALFDLERYPEADQLLEASYDAFLRDEDPHTGTALRWLQGRVALGLGDHPRAEEAFASSRDALLVIDRDYDAILASLDLAQVYLHEGRRGELRMLAVELVRLFRSRGVQREVFAALRLLAEAARNGEITLKLLQRVRERVKMRAGPREHVAANR